MSNNKNKKKNNGNKNYSQSKNNKVVEKKAVNKKAIIIIAAIVAVAITVAAVTVVLLTRSSLPTEAFDESGRFDYMNSNMKKYIAISSSDYKNTSASIPKNLEDSDEGLEAYIYALREEYAQSTGNKIVDRPIKSGDTVALRYEGWDGDKKFEGGSNMDDEKAHSLKIGSGSFIPGFEDALIGIIPNQTSKDNMRSIHLTFPEDYHSADMAGKNVVFKVYVEYIDEILPAEYTEEFITKTIKYTTTDKDVKASFEKYLKEEVIPSVRRNEMLSQIWEKLMEDAVVKKYPESEITYFYNQYVSGYEENKKYFETYYGMKYNTLGEFIIAYEGLDKNTDWEAWITENAKTDVSQNLLFHYIAQKENIIITDADYQKAITYYVNYYADYKYSAADIEKYMGARFLKEHALFEKVQDFLVENCTVTYE